MYIDIRDTQKKTFKIFKTFSCRGGSSCFSKKHRTYHKEAEMWLISGHLRCMFCAFCCPQRCCPCDYCTHRWLSFRIPTNELVLQCACTSGRSKSAVLRAGWGGDFATGSDVTIIELGQRYTNAFKYLQSGPKNQLEAITSNSTYFGVKEHPSKNPMVYLAI